MKHIFTLLLSLLFIHASAQSEQDQDVVRSISDESLNGSTIDYQINNYSIFQKEGFDLISIKNFSHLHEIGKPALPSNNDMFLIPEGSRANITILNLEADTLQNISAYPAQPPHSDESSDTLTFRKDDEFYKQDVNYPGKPVNIRQDQKIRNLAVGRVKVCPFQYNPAKKQLVIYRKISYRISFTPANAFFSNINKHSDHFLSTLPGKFLNGNLIKQEIENRKSLVPSPSPNYLLIAHENFSVAADTLARWKRQLGYNVKVISRNNWTSQQVNDSIEYYYQNCTPHPDYFVIMGDQQFVPALEYSTGSNRYTDLYYACMDSTTDYYPDMAHGRISVSTPGGANRVVDKIINYEKNPPVDSSFYNSGVNCAYFQDNDTSGYASRRFIHTSEEVRNYLIGKNYSVDRVYYTEPWNTPTHYNDGYYSNGQPLPYNLLMSSGFAWDGDFADVVQSINQGKFYVLHRDHGFSGGWSEPDFTNAHIPSLNNQNMLPVVFSINCSSGNFIKSESFAEKLLRAGHGGAVGIIAASSTSYSGFNDALSAGFFDAIWANPGLVPNFGSGGISNPPVNSHANIRHMGDVLNHGKLRMTQTWGDSRTSHELFHYHGDPSMKIWTQNPQTLVVNHQDTLSCDSTSLQIYSASVNNANATLTLDGKIIAEQQLIGGSTTLTFPAVSNKQAHAILTVHAEDHRPYISQIPIDGCTNPPVADFAVEDTVISIFNNSTKLYDKSYYQPSSRYWQIEPSAKTSFIQGTDSLSTQPVVRFSDTGYYHVKLVVNNSFGKDSLSRSQHINVYPAEQVPHFQNLETLNLSAIPADSTWNKISNGTYEWYLHNDSTPSFSTGPIIDHTTGSNHGTFLYTEASSGNAGDTAVFESPAFAIKNLDIPTLEFWYHMYGSEIRELSIDINTGNNWQPLNSIKGQQHFDYNDAWKKHSVDLSAYKNQVVKIRFRAIRGDGYKGDIAIDDIKIKDFSATPNISFNSSMHYSCCGHEVQFEDLSCCGVSSRQWVFPGGQPSSSSLKSPVVTYDSAGTYSVKLITTNSIGTDSLEKSSTITVRNNQTLPVLEDFESFHTGNPGTFLNDWATEKTNTFEWQVSQGGTPSSNTGPVYDHTKGNSGAADGKYIYTEASYSAEKEKAWLITPCLSLPAEERSYMEFWAHMYGSGVDTIHFDIYDGKQWFYDHYTIEGEQQSGHTDPWKKFNVDLHKFSGKDVKIELRAIRGNTYTDDKAIDDVRFFSAKMHLAPDSIFFGTTQPGAPSSDSFKIVNNTLDTLSLLNFNLPNGFQLKQSLPGYIQAGDSVFADVLFDPSDTIAYSGYLQIESNVNTDSVYLYGLGSPTGIESKDHSPSISIFPNPASNKLQISFNNIQGNQKCRIKILNIQGQIIKEEIVSIHDNAQISTSLRSLSNGIYQIHLITENFNYREPLIITQ
ncbi:MAG: C25 family cysteine peptidase [Bacteroidales bacterium]